MTKCTNLIGLSELIPLIQMVPAVPKCSYEERILGGIGKIDENPGIYIVIDRCGACSYEYFGGN